MPSVKVIVQPSADWEPFEPSIAGGEANRLQSGTTYHLPRDRDKLIIARYRFMIDNEGVQTVALGMSDPWTGTAAPFDHMPQNIEEHPSGYFHLLPKFRLSAYVDIQRPIHEWVEIARQRAAGEPGEESTFEIALSDGQDTGAIDRYQIAFGGTPLVPVADQEGVWKLSPGQFADYRRQEPILRATLMPTRRTYYLSRANNLLLEDVAKSSLPALPQD